MEFPGLGISPIVAEGAKAAIKDAFPIRTAAVTKAMVPEAQPDTIDQSLEATRRAQLKLYAQTQYGFYAVFQALVAVLAIAAVFALVVGIVRLTTGNPDTADAIVSAAVGVGALVSGAAAVFIQRQASEAKDRYLEALRLLEQ